MYLQDSKYSKGKYPAGYSILNGGWENSNHEITFDVGIFQPLNDKNGYAFYAKATELTGFKKLGNWTPGGLIIVELHRSTYKLNKNVNDAWIDVDAKPVNAECYLCDFLDSEKGQVYWKKFHKGKLVINDAEALFEMCDQFGVKIYLKKFEEVDGELGGMLFPKDEKAKGGAGGGSKGYIPVLAGEQAASRLKFIREFYKEAYTLNELPSLVEVAAYLLDDDTPNPQLVALLDRCLKPISDR